MLLKHRIASLGFLLVFLSAWVPSSVAHFFDPHHNQDHSSQPVINEGDHCPYCEIDLSVFTPFQPSFFAVTAEVNTLAPVAYIPSFSIEETFRVSSRGPPAC